MEEQDYQVFQRAIALKEMKRNENAVSILVDLHTRYPTDIDILSQIVSCMYDAGMMKGAREFTEKLLYADPDSDYGYNMMGLLLMADRDMPAAKSAFEQAISLDPANADYYANKALVLIHLKNHAAAYECAEEGLACDPHNYYCICHRLCCLYASQHTKLFREGMTEALVLYPQSAYLHYLHGKQLSDSGYHTEAYNALDTSLRINPMNEDAGSSLQKVYVNAKPMAYLKKITEGLPARYAKRLLWATVLLATFDLLNAKFNWLGTPFPLTGIFLIFITVLILLLLFVIYTSEPVEHISIWFDRYSHYRFHQTRGFAILALTVIGVLLIVVMIASGSGGLIIIPASISVVSAIGRHFMSKK